MNARIVKQLLATSLLVFSLGTAAAHGPGANDTYPPGYGAMGGYGMGPGMMGRYGPGYGAGMGRTAGPNGYGPGARPMWGYEGGYGMGPGMGAYGAEYYGMGPGMMGGYGMMGMMMGGFGSGYGMMGGYGSAMTGILKLSDTQQKQIQQIQEKLAQKQWGLMQSMHSLMWSKQAPSKTGEIDVEAIMKRAKGLQDMRLEMLRGRLEAEKQIEDLLTKEQREKLSQMYRWGW